MKLIKTTPTNTVKPIKAEKFYGRKQSRKLQELIAKTDLKQADKDRLIHLADTEMMILNLIPTPRALRRFILVEFLFTITIVGVFVAWLNLR